MKVALDTNAEKRALDALRLSSFKGLDLIHVKESLSDMLEHLTDQGMFDQYTKHDISHVNGMLKLVDDIIPAKVVDVLTPTDWLMIVLSIYFHDLGMLITHKEYESRDSCSDYNDYLLKINEEAYEKIADDKRDRSKYQDYVRINHGDRIFDWINGVADLPDGSHAVKKILYDLLHNLDKRFRKDLALICRSHQKDLLTDSAFYNTKQQYEQDSDSKVNLLYCAAVLRTADLLHVTSERTPDISFLIVSPDNAYSRREWVMQKSVSCIRPLDEKNRQGVIDDTIERYRFEIIANFTDEDAYSHFMSYLDYVESELKKTSQVCRESARVNSNNYIFPWTGIERSNISTEGFLAKKLRFELDEKNILSLLTGHTLYSHANVVLRELTQNAIDAGRLESQEYKISSGYTPKVFIHWDSKKRLLTVKDNGTGMSRDIIQKYLFKVGASRYQSDEFKRENPSFHSISRFGIGILTCFMISDEILITTLYHGEHQACQIKIKNLQGDYFMRTDVSADSILEGKHGTTFALKVRDGVVVENIEEDLRKWIWFPKCEVSLKIDEDAPLYIGYESIRKAMQTILQKNAISDKSSSYEVKVKTIGCVEIAYIINKNDLYDSWTLCSMKDILSDDFAPIGICVEGVRVTRETPGYNDRRYVVMVNCTGPQSPKTNVARDKFEQTPELVEVIKSIYSTYLRVVQEQSDDISQRYSLFWGASEASYSIDKLCANRSEIDVFTDKKCFDAQLEFTNCLMIDDGQECKILNLSELSDEVWTIESQAYTSAIQLVQDVKNCKKSPSLLIKEIGLNENDNPGLIYTNNNLAHYVGNLFLDRYQVNAIHVYHDTRKIELCWKKGVDNWYWTSTKGHFQYSHLFVNRIFVQKNSEFKYKKIGSESIIVAGNNIFILEDSPLNEYMTKLFARTDEGAKSILEVVASYIANFLDNLISYYDEDYDVYLDDYDRDSWDSADREKFRQIVKSITDKDVVDYARYYKNPNAAFFYI